ncbi:MAG: ATP-binding protein [Owenweeksia sp.]|nr:ATP-binding protein [Owenweeksia sp.]
MVRHRMRQIILDLLEYSRVGKHEDELEEVKLAAILEEVKALHHRKFADKKAKLSFGELPVLYTYRTPLKQIMQNLIANSLTYSARGVPPQIKVSAKEKKKEYEICVQDNGIGMSDEYFDKIFVIFQRLHLREDYEGTGMGLAIVKKNVESLGGRVWVESEEKKGSRFYFTLPRLPKAV